MCVTWGFDHFSLYKQMAAVSQLIHLIMASPCKSQSSSCSSSVVDDDRIGLRRGPWTVDEDSLLVHSISVHGEGRWNLLAIRSGLRRTGKSCRLRWLNYLKPDVKRGNLSPQEQLLILDLHCRWGNRWSKIAQELPGRTDNEIKNYWRTRVQKQAKLMNIDTNSPEFKDIINRFWIPRLVHQINEESSNSSSPSHSNSDHEKRHRFVPSEIDEKVTGSDPLLFSDVPSSWNHCGGGGGGGDMGDFFYPIGDLGSQFTGCWMEEDDSDGGSLWNFDSLWQF